MPPASRSLSSTAICGCPTESTLALHAAQALTLPERGALEAHAATCEACDTALAMLRGDASAERSASGLRGGASSGSSLTPFARRAQLALDLAAGAQLGRFRVLRRVGQGAMGLVVAAFDPELEREVALKVLLEDDDAGARARAPGPQGKGDDARRHRILREARSMAKLCHPHVVTVYETGVAGGRVFLAMELVSGQTLADWLASKPAPARVVALFEQVAQAVDAAHRAGVVHRDLKPQNILVTAQGSAKVTDFGLAAVDSADTDGAPLAATAERGGADRAQTTQRGTSGIVGTPAYMSPQVLLGERAGPKDDQFSLGVCVHEALTGARPYGATDVRTLKAQVISDAPSISPSLPPAVAKVLARALARRPGDRFASVAEFGAALGAAMRDDEAAPPARPSARWPLRAGLALATPLLLGAAALLLALARPSELPRAAAGQAFHLARVSVPAAAPPSAIAPPSPSAAPKPPARAATPSRRPSAPAAPSAPPAAPAEEWDWKRSRR